MKIEIEKQLIIKNISICRQINKPNLFISVDKVKDNEDKVEFHIVIKKDNEEKKVKYETIYKYNNPFLAYSDNKVKIYITLKDRDIGYEIRVLFKENIELYSTNGINYFIIESLFYQDNVPNTFSFSLNLENKEYKSYLEEQLKKFNPLTIPNNFFSLYNKSYTSGYIIPTGFIKVYKKESNSLYKLKNYLCALAIDKEISARLVYIIEPQEDLIQTWGEISKDINIELITNLDLGFSLNNVDYSQFDLLVNNSNNLKLLIINSEESNPDDLLYKLIE
jgi:hypothetical protein